MELEEDSIDTAEVKVEKVAENKKKRSQNYVSQSAVALRCRVMPPPCIKNPYLKDGSEMDVDPFGNQRSKCSGRLVIFPAKVDDLDTLGILLHFQ